MCECMWSVIMPFSNVLKSLKESSAVHVFILLSTAQCILYCIYLRTADNASFAASHLPLIYSRRLEFCVFANHLVTLILMVCPLPGVLSDVGKLYKGHCQVCSVTWRAGCNGDSALRHAASCVCQH